jgi:hypothetical protein
MPEGGWGRGMKKTWQKTSEPRDLHALEGQFIALADGDWLISEGCAVLHAVQASGGWDARACLMVEPDAQY